MLPHDPTQLQHQQWSESFDSHIDWREFLRGMVLALVVLLRREQPLQQSFASLLALALLLGLQYAACDVFLHSIFSVAGEFGLTPISSESHQAVITSSAALFAAGFSWLAYPHFNYFIHRRLLNCIYLRPSLWHITGGPREIPQNEPFRSLPAIARALQLREMYMPKNELAVGHFSIEVLLKHCAYIGLAGWYNSSKLRARCCTCFKMLRYVIQAVLFISSMVVFFTAGIPDLRSKCDNDDICRDLIQRSRLWFAHDCIINAGYFIAPHLFLFRVPFVKVITETFASLALAFIWLRPVVEPLLNMLLKFRNFAVVCLASLKHVWLFFQKGYERIVKVVKFLLTPVRILLQIFVFVFSKFKTVLMKLYEMASHLWSGISSIFSVFKSVLSQFSLPVWVWDLLLWYKTVVRMFFSVLQWFFAELPRSLFKNTFDAFKGASRANAAAKQIAEGAAINAGAKVVKAVDFLEGVNPLKVENRRAARGVWERITSVTVPKWCVRLLKCALCVVAAYFALSLVHHTMHHAAPLHGPQ